MRIIVVGGGTATNAIAPVFPRVAYRIGYVVPVSDNGGSTSEILRAFGGPAIGDARSRLVRLMEPGALRALLALRLSDNSALARQEWADVVEGTHVVWADVEPHMKAMYRAFLVTIHAELLKKTAGGAGARFDFRSASVGNLLLTGARLYFGTLEAAIEFVLLTTRVSSQFLVLPGIDSSIAHHIAADLADGSVIVGQNAISHPADQSEQLAETSAHSDPSVEADGDDLLYSHPSLRSRQISFAKLEAPPLPSPIQRLYYVNMYGDEIRPRLSPRVSAEMQTADAVIFSVGSLFTSIVPVLLLQGFGASLPRQRLLILNGTEDRETWGMRPSDHVAALNSALIYSMGLRGPAKVSTRQRSRTLESITRSDMHDQHQSNINKLQELHTSDREVKKSSDTFTSDSVDLSDVSVDQRGSVQFITSVIFPSHMDVSDLLTLGIQTIPAECPNGEYNLSSLETALEKALAETGPSLLKLDDLMKQL